MKFVERGKVPPTTGQFVREEHLRLPYRGIPYGAGVGVEQSPQRLNIEIDMLNRIIASTPPDDIESRICNRS